MVVDMAERFFFSRAIWPVASRCDEKKLNTQINLDVAVEESHRKAPSFA